jgi:hypothetical protein
MTVRRWKSKGVFCLEGAWDPDLKSKQSVRYMLQLLSAVEGLSHIYRDVATLEELRFYLQRWGQKRYKDHPILYLAFHGQPQTVLVGKQSISLDEIAALLAGRCEKRIIHFGTCGTLATDRRNISRFLRRTGAVAVCGFLGDIDWLKSTAFDLLLFEIIQRYEISLRGIPAFHREVKRSYPQLYRELGFRLVYLENHP